MGMGSCLQRGDFTCITGGEIAGASYGGDSEASSERVETVSQVFYA